MGSSPKKLFELIKKLPEEKRREVIDFVEYLHFREIERKGITDHIIEGIKQVKNKKVRPARELLNDL